MSIRITVLYLLVAFFVIYAWRDWFKSCCALIVLMAFVQHPDMPHNIMGMQGLNCWNALMASVACSWLVNRRREGSVWDMPGHMSLLLLIYLGVVAVGFIRMMLDRAHLGHFGTAELISENLINCVKWAVPGLLIFDGCRTRSRLTIAIAAILVMYLLLALQVIRWMPPSAALSGDELEARSKKIIQNETGYNRVNMSMILSGASWALLATLPAFRKPSRRVLVVGGFLVIAYAQALTGGRMGYATWGAVGVALCALRWRKALFVLPLIPLAIAIVLPGVTERMLQGFGDKDVRGRTVTSDYDVTAGRTLIWPYVIEKIWDAPVLGHGRLAMTRTGLESYLRSEYHESFPHPHNAYLQWLLDNGVIGLVLVMPFYFLIVFYASRMFMDSSNVAYPVVGGVACALIFPLLIAAMGSQTFYPREGAVGMWAAIGIMLRVHVQRSRALAGQRAVGASPSLANLGPRGGYAAHLW